MSDLLPCPHCGGEGQPTGPNEYGKGTVRCISCAAESGWGKTPEAATRLWNMRVYPKHGSTPLSIESEFSKNDDGEMTQTDTYPCGCRQTYKLSDLPRRKPHIVIDDPLIEDDDD